jgi:hypothetical protein
VNDSDLFQPTRSDLVNLIDWLALPYAGDPVFAVEGEPPNEYKDRLRQTWEYVIGTKGVTAPGAWSQCQCCGHWAVRTMEPIRDVNNEGVHAHG